MEPSEIKPRHAAQGSRAMRDVPGPSRVIYRYLADCADNDTLKCWPSIAAICDDLDFSRRTVSTHLGKLEEAGYIFIDSGQGRHKVSTYTLNRGKALTLYLALLRRKQERAAEPGWKSSQAARPAKPKTPAEPSAPEEPAASDWSWVTLEAIDTTMTNDELARFIKARTNDDRMYRAMNRNLDLETEDPAESIWLG